MYGFTYHVVSGCKACDSTFRWLEGVGFREAAPSRRQDNGSSDSHNALSSRNLVFCTHVR